MKTNFEKWRDSLTAEDFVLSRSSDNTKFVGILCHRNCPAASTCPARKEYPKNIQRWWDLTSDCDKWFFRWANAPAKEDTK